jgi:eukaryotic-like serine/threonine-protein kinase
MGTRIGSNIGRYEIVAEIGRGGMGVVYQARDPKIDRLVAIKTISLLGQEPDEEQDYRQRFAQEAQAAGRLSHPGIVTIFDVGEEPENREPYIVMEYVAGESLKKMLTLGDHAGCAVGLRTGRCPALCARGGRHPS